MSYKEYRLPKRQSDLPFWRTDFTPMIALDQVKINRDSKTEQNVVVGCAEGMKSNILAAKSLCLKLTVSFVVQNSPLLNYLRF